MKFTTIIFLLAGTAVGMPNNILSHGRTKISKRQDTVCPDPFDVCQYAESDGTCTIGYEGCIKKTCSVCDPLDLGCAGCAAGKSSIFKWHA
ncbi:uncharacterized protein JN550_011636 [Neoarthrinium moseri]|uniref:uncharacterized protein n=1 Tax=Neoarthrinium moseri TaxID=1658444 RepID=UPI001FDE0420|nr:uncharacterized protein JN550_011636 [Neoarthrinium moseri]KAI1860258.1 hypothetical protein JN550_011636 [Neoarthrinium moseri]